jgi:uncharacterized protein (TIRG00374 family)
MSRKLRATIGVLLSLLLLWWALRDVSAAEVARQLASANGPLLTAALVISLSGFYIRAFRWGILLLPLGGKTPFLPRIAAVFIGFAANNVLPARVGEFARAFVLARLTTVRPAAALGTLVVERLLDGIVLVGLLFAAMAAPGFATGSTGSTAEFRTGASIAAMLVLLVTAGLFLVAAAPHLASRIAHRVSRGLPERFRHPFLEALRSFAAGLTILRNPRLFAVSLALALGQWLFLAVSYLLAFRAFGIQDVPFSGAVFLQSIIGLAVAIPSSPGFFGPFEAAARVGLSLWDVPASQAVSFAIGFHIAGFLPVTLIGVYYVWRLNLRWTDVRGSEAAVESEIENSALAQRQPPEAS